MVANETLMRDWPSLGMPPCHPGRMVRQSSWSRAEGEAALVSIDRQALSSLKEEFNRTAANTRVILLVSPT
jgi:hypothetical protein